MKIIALFGFIAVTHSTMMGEWNVTINDECIIQISQPLNKDAFISSSQLIQVGHGNVDQITIIKDGDI